MMLPPDPCLYMCGSTARVVRNAPSRWIARSFFQSANGNCSSGLTIWTPALLTRMSIFPNCCTVRATPASTCCSLVTSMTTPSALPAPPNSVAVASAAFWLRSAITTRAPSRTKVLAISLPMPLAAPVTMATLSLSRMSRHSCAGGSARRRRLALRRGRLEIVVGDLAEPEREIADHVDRGHHFEHRQLRHRRQRVRGKRQRRRAGPGALERDVLEIVLNKLADPRAAVDVRDDLEQEVGRRQRGTDGVEIGGLVLVSHRGGRHPDRPVVERSDQLVDLDMQGRAGELLGEAPQLAAAGDRRLVVEEHAMGVSALAATELDRDHLPGLGVVAEARGVRHADEFVLDQRLVHFERLWHQCP